MQKKKRKLRLTKERKRIKLNLLFKLSYLSLSFALTLRYLNSASNNPAQMSEGKKKKSESIVRRSTQLCAAVLVFINVQQYPILHKP